MAECALHGPHQGWYFWDGYDESGEEEHTGGIETYCIPCTNPVQPSELVAHYRDERISRRISIYDAARQLNLTPAEFSAIETGKAEPNTHFLLGMYELLA